jgi:hypothetical protein
MDNLNTIATNVRTTLAEAEGNRETWRAMTLAYLDRTREYWDERVNRSRLIRADRELVESKAKLRDPSRPPAGGEYEWVDDYRPLPGGGVLNVSGWLPRRPMPIDPEAELSADYAWLAMLHDLYCTRGQRGVAARPIVETGTLSDLQRAYWERLRKQVDRPDDLPALISRLAEALVRVRADLASGQDGKTSRATPTTAGLAEPTERDWAVYRCIALLGISPQQEVANVVNRMANESNKQWTPIDQGGVSKAKKKCVAWVKAGGIMPREEPERAKSSMAMDPSKLEMGKRVDGRASHIRQKMRQMADEE